jgi:hypothetical protein
VRSDPSSLSLRSGKSIASSIGDTLMSMCWVDGVRVRSFYNHTFKEVKLAPCV